MQNSERPSRGTRIDPQWSPSEQDRQLAKQEGFQDHEIQREASRFRDYWTARPGAGGVKLDWSATWRNWIRTAGEKLGKKPAGPASANRPPDWDLTLKSYTSGTPGRRGSWVWKGAEPGCRGCIVPAEIQRKHGFEPFEERGAS